MKELCCVCFCMWLGNIYTGAVPVEEELFNSAKQEKLEWQAYPAEAWKPVNMQLGSGRAHRVYQACNAKYNGLRKTLWTLWIPRGDARHLFVDLRFAQESEDPDPLHNLSITLVSSSGPLRSLRPNPAHHLRANQSFHPEASVQEIERTVSHVRGLPLGPVTQGGFHLGLAYWGPCVFIGTLKLYYNVCPGLVGMRMGFRDAVGGSQARGVCVNGSLELSPPYRDCRVNGEWGDVRGECVCAPGYQQAGEFCKACRPGTYKPTNGSGVCVPCPPNSAASEEGMKECKCMLGYYKVPGDPTETGCTKPPTFPTTLWIPHQNASSLVFHWHPPQDLGGRAIVWYDVECQETLGHPEGVWHPCGPHVHYSPTSQRLTDTAVSVTGLRPHADYRLTVRARNDVNSYFNISASAASLTIDRYKVHLVPTSVPVRLEEVQTSFFPRVLLAGVLATLLVGGLIVVTSCLIRRRYSKLSDQNVELLPINQGVTFRRPEQQQEQQSTTWRSTTQLPDGLSEPLLTSLKEVLVDRRTLTVGKELGAGEYGSVYEGNFSPDEGTSIKVAVKTMRVGIYNREDLESFLKEVDIMKNFNHKNVLSLLGVTLEQKEDSPMPMPMVILPFLKHGDLRRFLMATRYGDIPMFVPYQCLLRFMVDIAAGMEYLSSHGFIHRDLAARNCMLGDDLRVCVADFGLSKKIYCSDYYRQTAAIRLPIKWMALESLVDNIFSTKSDVWSFGVTMWEIVTRGKTPYSVISNHELPDMLESGHRLKSPDCDHRLYELMLRCWHREPAQRPTFLQLEQELKALLSQLPHLEANLETLYINQGLEAAERGCPDGWDLESREEQASRNLYLPGPVATCHETEDKDGYLLCSPYQ